MLSLAGSKLFILPANLGREVFVMFYTKAEKQILSYKVALEAKNKETKVPLFFKFGKYKWMKKLSNGELSFSCTGNFINEAIKTGNNIQGDAFEGVFARLKNNDIKIEQMKEKLKDDLEILEDTEPYVLLRRKSSKYKPIFCLYSYTYDDIYNECDNPKVGANLVKHKFHDDMYSGFAESLSIKNVLSPDEQFTQVVFSKSEDFLNRLKCAILSQDHIFKISRVNYTEFEQEEFFIEPSATYNELFYKFPKYKGQHEARICLLDMDFNDYSERYSLNIGTLSDDECKIEHTPFYFVSTVIFKKK